MKEVYIMMPAVNRNRGRFLWISAEMKKIYAREKQSCLILYFQEMEEMERYISTMVGKGYSLSETISFALGRYHDQLLILLTAAAEFVLFLPLVLRYRRLYRRSQLGEMECREVFVRLLGMLRAEGYMDGYTGNEPDFAKALSSKIPCVEQAEAEKLQEIIQKTAYGNKAASEEENELVRKIYIKVSKYIESQMRGVQKIRFKYLSRNL